MAEQKKKETHVKVCPKCSSINIKIDLTHAFLGETSTHTCEECGYTNTFFPEVDASRIKDFVKNAEKARK